MMNQYTIAGLLCTGLLNSAAMFAQIGYGGTPPGLVKSNDLSSAPVAVMPLVDAATLIAEDEARYADGIKGPYRFGFNHATDLALDNSGAWTELPNGDRVWQLKIECPGALSVNFEFHDYVIPDGGEVYVYNEVKEVLGAFTAASNGGQLTMGVGQLAGDRITIEYLEPQAVRGLGRLQVGQVTHGYRDVLGLAKGLGDSGSCNNNVICPEGVPWQDQIRSVAMIVVGGGGICTGQLVNNCAENGVPYFLTARHCLPGNQNVNNWVYRFNWNSPQCAQNLNGPTNQTLSGSQLLVQNAGSDMALIQITTTPPSNYNVYYSGWDHSTTPSTSNVAIHHPSGDVKKISFDNHPATMASFGGAQCWRVANWEDGTTEPGSSGSGLWNQNGHLTGQLYGGQASCSNNVNDYYGRLNVSWPVLQPILGSCGPTLDGWDPNDTETYTYDAALQSISGVPASLCNENLIQPSVTIKNNGTATLTALTINYAVSGGGPNGGANWSGSLAADATTIFQLPEITVPSGTLSLTLTAANPNGQPDENAANNAVSTNFVVASPGAEATLELTLDNYGSETTWQLTPQGGGAVIASGGPYQNGNQPMVVSEWCLATGCYTFTIDDDWGDGICCEYGEGSLEILDGNGQVLAAHNGQFGSSASVDFCMTTSGVGAASAQLEMELLPNPTDGTFAVEFASILENTARMTIMDMTGRLVQEYQLAAGTHRATASLQGHASGTYLVRIATDQMHHVERLMLVH